MPNRSYHKWCSVSAIRWEKEETYTIQNIHMYKERLPSGSVWSGRPFLVECVNIGKATESAEQRANLNFFFASLKEEKYFLNKVAARSASSISNLNFLFFCFFKYCLKVI